MDWAAVCYPLDTPLLSALTAAQAVQPRPGQLMSAINPQLKSTTDRYPVIQSIDGPTGISWVSASRKSPLHPCQNPHL